MNRTGFSLLSVLIAGTLLIGIGLAVGQLVGSMSRGAKSVEVRGARVDLLNSVRLGLSNPKICSCNLTPPSALPTLSTSSLDSYVLDVNQLRLFDENCTAQATLVEENRSSKGLLVQDISVRNFKRISDSQYFAKLRFDIQKKAGTGVTTVVDELTVSFRGQVASGTLTLESCELEPARATASSTSESGEFFGLKLRNNAPCLSTHSICTSPPATGSPLPCTCTVPSGKVLALEGMNLPDQGGSYTIDSKGVQTWIVPPNTNPNIYIDNAIGSYHYGTAFSTTQLTHPIALSEGSKVRLAGEGSLTGQILDASDWSPAAGELFAIRLNDGRSTHPFCTSHPRFSDYYYDCTAPSGKGIVLSATWKYITSAGKFNSCYLGKAGVPFTTTWDLFDVPVLPHPIRIGSGSSIRLWGAGNRCDYLGIVYNE